MTTSPPHSGTPAHALAELGLDADAVQALLDRAARDVDDGRLPSCSLAVARHGRVAVSATFGSVTEKSRYVVFSVTKAVIAAAVWQLVGERRLRPETRVAELVPEFAAAGKAAVTVEHLLTHTAGFPRAPMRPEEGAESAGRRARFARWRLDWEPGSRTEYHAVSAHWVAAEVIEQASGTDYRRLVAERLLRPLGLQALQLGVPLDEQHDVLDVEIVQSPDPGAGGRDRPEVPVVATSAQLLRYNEPAVRAVGVPGAGAVSTAADVALLYQAFLHDRDGLWHPDVLADATGRVRNRLPDPWTGVPANRTLGLVLAGDDGHAAVREFGRAAGPRAFGACGLGGQIAWADPDSGLSFCYLTNGLETDLVRAFARSATLSTLAARCVPGREALRFTRRDVRETGE